jgi:hypothetical protein
MVSVLNIINDKNKEFVWLLWKHLFLDHAMNDECYLLAMDSQVES